MSSTPADVNGKNPGTSAPTERRGIQSVEIAYRVLTALKEASPSMPLREIAARSGLTPSAANNYLVSLVRTGLVSNDDRAGSYRLGPAALSLGMSALQQIDGFDVVRREVMALRDVTGRNTALAGWSDAGPVSLFKQDGEHRGAFEMRTGLIPMISTAAGKVFIACLPPAATLPLIAKELAAAGKDPARCEEVLEEARRELARNGYAAITKAHPSGYVSIAAPVWDWHGDSRFSISLIGSRDSLDTSRNSAHAKSLLEAATRATNAMGGAPRALKG